MGEGKEEGEDEVTVMAEAQSSRAPGPWTLHRVTFQLRSVKVKVAFERRSALCLDLDLHFIRAGIDWSLAVVVCLSLSCSPPAWETCLSFLGWGLA